MQGGNLLKKKKKNACFQSDTWLSNRSLQQTKVLSKSAFQNPVKDYTPEDLKEELVKSAAIFVEKKLEFLCIGCSKEW